MEKNGVVAIGASKATGEEVPVPIQAPAVLLQILHGWDPYEEVDYIRPENPDGSIHGTQKTAWCVVLM